MVGWSVGITYHARENAKKAPQAIPRTTQRLEEVGREVASLSVDDRSRLAAMSKFDWTDGEEWVKSPYPFQPSENASTRGAWSVVAVK